MVGGVGAEGAVGVGVGVGVAVADADGVGVGVDVGVCDAVGVGVGVGVEGAEPPAGAKTTSTQYWLFRQLCVGNREVAP